MQTPRIAPERHTPERQRDCKRRESLDQRSWLKSRKSLVSLHSATSLSSPWGRCSHCPKAQLSPRHGKDPISFLSFLPIAPTLKQTSKLIQRWNRNTLGCDFPALNKVKQSREAHTARMCPAALLPFKHHLESPDPLTAAGVCLRPTQKLLVIKAIDNFNTSRSCPTATMSSLISNVLAGCFKHPVSWATPVYFYGAAESGSSSETRAPPTPLMSWQRRKR